MARRSSRTATTRSLLAGFILISALPVAALLWLGFELASQERLLQSQRDAERRELAAGRVVAAMEKLLVSAEHDLDLDAPLAAGAIRIRLTDDHIEVRPPEGILCMANS